MASMVNLVHGARVWPVQDILDKREHRDYVLYVAGAGERDQAVSEAEFVGRRHGSWRVLVTAD